MYIVHYLHPLYQTISPLASKSSHASASELSYGRETIRRRSARSRQAQSGFAAFYNPLSTYKKAELQIKNLQFGTAYRTVSGQETIKIISYCTKVGLISLPKIFIFISSLYFLLPIIIMLKAALL